MMLGTPYTCLYIEEVFLRICAFVAPDPEGSHTLAALLRVCKAFYEPTLDTLWYEQASMETLRDVFRSICGGLITNMVSYVFTSSLCFLRVHEQEYSYGYQSYLGDQ